MDEWDYLDEVNVIALWPSEQKKNVESAKWQERKEALESLTDIIEKNPRLSTATLTIYGEVLDNLKKIIQKDSNINVVMAALKLLIGIANGLRTKFQSFVMMFWPHILDKAKDKKANVRDLVGDTLDAFANTCDADRLSKDLCEHLVKPSPQAKQCLCLFLYRRFKRQPSCSIDFCKAVLPVLVKLASDSDATVRDSSCAALGSARRFLGKALDVFLQPINTDKNKLDKIEEYHQKALKEYAEENVNRPSAVRAEGREEEGEKQEEMTTADATTANVDPWTIMDPVDIASKLNKDWSELISSKKWQERKDAADAICSIMETSPRAQLNPELTDVMNVLVKTLDKDVNVNVSSAVAKALTGLANGLRHDFAHIVAKAMSICFDKLKEKKPVLRNELIALVDAASFTASLDDYVESVSGGFEAKNPQSRAQTALFLYRHLSQHSAATIPMNFIKQISPLLVKISSDADGEVRDAAFQVISAIWRCTGETAVKRLFSDLVEDKAKMEKITEYQKKIQEEKGNVASPEVLRIYKADVSKVAPKPSASVSVSSRPVSSASRPVSRPTTAAAPRPAPTVSRPSTASVRPIPPTSRAPVKVLPTAVNGAPIRKPLATASSGNGIASRATVTPRAPSTSRERVSMSERKPIVARPNVIRSTPQKSMGPTTAPLKPSARNLVFKPANVVRENLVKPLPPSQPVANSNPVAIASNGSGIQRPSTSSGIRPPSARPATASTGIPLPRSIRPPTPSQRINESDA